MEYNVVQLLKEPIGAVRDYDLAAAPEFLPEVNAVAPYTGHARLTNIGNGVMAKVSISTEVALSCDRCLVEIRQPLEVDFSDVFRPSVDVNTGAPLPVDEKEDPFKIEDDHVLDLTEAIRQYAVFNLPMHAVCREECKGLCPTCGVNLNETDCGHAKQSLDPRLAVLAELLDDDDKE